MFAAACSKAPAPATDAQPASPPAAAQGMPATTGDPSLSSVSGLVVETMDSGGYTYLKLKTATGEEWTAVSQTPVKTGDDVTVADATLMQGFESRTLKRTFDRIYFGRLVSGENAAGAAAQAGDAPPAMLAALAAQHGAASAAAPKGDVKVPRAEGPEGHTIAELYAGKAALKDKTVLVRGTVVKFNAAIMGRNWVHIRDGSGSAEAKDNDLTLTTQDSAAVGDVVLARGTLHLDKDFGAGYTYVVILEDATLKR